MSASNGNGKGPQRPLNKKQLDFVLGVLAGKPDYIAYMDAYGVGEKVAQASAPRLLAQARVQDELARLRADVIDRVVEETAIDKVWVMQKLVKNVRRCMQEEGVETNEGGKVVTVFDKYNAAGANKALELIGTELGMFKVRVQDIPWDELDAEDLRQIEKGVLPFKLRKMVA